MAELLSFESTPQLLSASIDVCRGKETQSNLALVDAKGLSQGGVGTGTFDLVEVCVVHDGSLTDRAAPKAEQSGSPLLRARRRSGSHWNP